MVPSNFSCSPYKISKEIYTYSKRFSGQISIIPGKGHKETFQLYPEGEAPEPGTGFCR
jgi:hypothetical protein